MYIYLYKLFTPKHNVMKTKMYQKAITLKCVLNAAITEKDETTQQVLFLYVREACKELITKINEEVMDSSY